MVTVCAVSVPNSPETPVIVPPLISAAVKLEVAKFKALTVSPVITAPEK